MIDLAHDPLGGFLRYLLLLDVSESEFGIRMRPKGKLWYLGVGANPWKTPVIDIDLGQLMRNYHGGGHKNIGATEFHSKTEAIAAVEEIMEKLKMK